MAITSCSDPDEILSAYPCLNCLSQKELLVVLTGLFANQQGYLADLDTLEAATVRFRNLGNLEFLRGAIATLPDSYFAGLDTSNLLSAFGCLDCYSEQKLKEMILFMWCSYWNQPV